MRTVLMGQYEGGEPEEIDEVDGDNTYEFLLAEYTVSFGKGWRFWKERKPDDDS